MTLRQKVATGISAVAVVLLIPIPYLASPEWTIAVTDETDRPLPGMRVSLSHENYSAEDTDHEMSLWTDATGRVVFPAQKQAASLLSRLYFTTRSAMALAHASFGPSAFVTVFGNGREGSVNSGDGTVYFWNGHPDRISSTIVARPRE